MVNTSLLREKIADSGMTITALARKVGLSREAVYYKLNGKKAEFTASQIVNISNALHLTNDERDEIFLR